MRVLMAMLVAGTAGATAVSCLAASQSAESVSMVQLIATPEKFDGKAIQVVGFLRLEFEGNALYLHREDYDHGIYRNALWIEFPHDQDGDKVNGRYVFVQGTFRAKLHGHMDLFSGTISDAASLFAPHLERRDHLARIRETDYCEYRDVYLPRCI
jgi:hypothetical protein